MPPNVAEVLYLYCHLPHYCDRLRGIRSKAYSWFLKQRLRKQLSLLLFEHHQNSSPSVHRHGNWYPVQLNADSEGWARIGTGGSSSSPSAVSTHLVFPLTLYLPHPLLDDCVANGCRTNWQTWPSDPSYLVWQINSLWQQSRSL